MADDDVINLQRDVDNHERELDRLSKQIKELEEDIRVIIRVSPGNLLEQARQKAAPPIASPFAGAQQDDSAFREQCKRFYEKYRPDRE